MCPDEKRSQESHTSEHPQGDGDGLERAIRFVHDRRQQVVAGGEHAGAVSDAWDLVLDRPAPSAVPPLIWMPNVRAPVNDSLLVCQGARW